MAMEVALIGRVNRPLLSVCASVLLAVALLGAGSANAAQFRIQSLKEIREQGVVMQRWETSCAAASVATVLTYAFQDPVSEYFVAARMLENTEPARVRSRGGFSLLDMKNFVEAQGYNGSAYQYLSLDDLRLFRAPIVPIRVRGLSHYVVLNAMNSRNVMLADPAFGNRTMPLSRFEKIWIDGLAFVVTPGSGTTQ